MNRLPIVPWLRTVCITSLYSTDFEHSRKTLFLSVCVCVCVCPVKTMALIYRRLSHCNIYDDMPCASSAALSNVMSAAESVLLLYICPVSWIVSQYRQFAVNARRPMRRNTLIRTHANKHMRIVDSKLSVTRSERIRVTHICLAALRHRFSAAPICQRTIRLYQMASNIWR